MSSFDAFTFLRLCTSDVLLSRVPATKPAIGSGAADAMLSEAACGIAAGIKPWNGEPAKIENLS